MSYVARLFGFNFVLFFAKYFQKILKIQNSYFTLNQLRLRANIKL